jgi:hypothetical protein
MTGDVLLNATNNKYNARERDVNSNTLEVLSGNVNNTKNNSVKYPKKCFNHILFSNAD